MALDELTIEELEKRADSLTDADLQYLIQNDEREGARKFAQDTLAERTRLETPPPPSEYNPRTDLGPKRPEDVVPESNLELTSPEVDLETQRKDETTVLATDHFNSDGKRVIYE